MLLGSFYHGRLKVNEYTFKGSNSTGPYFASFLNGGQLLKNRICSCRSKFFPLGADPILLGIVAQKSIPGNTKFVSLCKNDGKSMQIYPCILMENDVVGPIIKV